ncbi:MAG: hypothetical protein LT071_04420 [Nocardioides sp.]|nr:hypothetical protein [Nocardioides sp.]
MLTALRMWPARRWLVALAATVGTVLVIGVPTDLIDTPVFGRSVPPTAWAWPSLLVSSVLAGLLLASYVANPVQTPTDTSSRRGGWIGGALTFFAVGCPVCNKLVLLALGSAGAMTWFAPVQPWLQAAAIVLLAWALRKRLLGELSCVAPPPREMASA